MGFAQIRLVRGRARWRTDSATNLHRKAFYSCKLFVYIWLPGASPPDPTMAPPLDPAGQIPCACTLTSEHGFGYATFLKTDIVGAEVLSGGSSFHVGAKDSRFSTVLTY